jgi:hypothetical protein
MSNMTVFAIAPYIKEHRSGTVSEKRIFLEDLN